MNHLIDQERQAIDQIDVQIRTLLNERAKHAQKIGELKGGLPVYRPEREAQVLRKAMAENPGPLKTDMIFRIQREIMSACLALENSLTIGIEKDQHLSLIAVREQFGSFAAPRLLTSPEEALKELEACKVDYLLLHESSLFYLISDGSFPPHYFVQGEWQAPNDQGSFFLIGSENNPPSGQDKTLMLLTQEELNRLIKQEEMNPLRTVLLEEGEIIAEFENYWHLNIDRETGTYRILGSYPYF